MLKTAVIAILLISTASGAFLAYRSGQKVISLGVLLDDKNSALADRDAKIAALTQQTGALQAALDALRAAEAERQAQQAALNAAKVSEADVKQFGTPCKDWIATNFGDRDYPDYSRNSATIEDAWMKDGLYVFEIAFPADLGATTRNVLLCVFDRDKQSMFKPSAFDMNNWRRNR